jgi:hypothetical protein
MLRLNLSRRDSRRDWEDIATVPEASNDAMRQRRTARAAKRGHRPTGGDVDLSREAPDRHASPQKQ